MNIGKKILSALIELPEEERQQASAPVTNVDAQPHHSVAADGDTEKFRDHFGALLEEANEPGPDYFEFARMIGAMRAIADEGARYQAAFAGLQAQGLGKQQLLQSAQRYLALLDEDAQRFRQTVDHAQQEKVTARKQELEENSKRIEALALEITRLQQRNQQLEQEVREQHQKLESNDAAYQRVLGEEQGRIRADIERITKHIL